MEKLQNKIDELLIKKLQLRDRNLALSVRDNKVEIEDELSEILNLNTYFDKFTCEILKINIKKFDKNSSNLLNLIMGSKDLLIQFNKETSELIFMDYNSGNKRVYIPSINHLSIDEKVFVWRNKKKLRSYFRTKDLIIEEVIRFLE